MLQKHDDLIKKTMKISKHILQILKKTKKGFEFIILKTLRIFNYIIYLTVILTDLEADL
jgi:hypothetical protein